MTYESVKTIESAVAPGVKFTVIRMSFGRRLELMQQVRELARKVEYLEAAADAGSQMDAAMVRAEIDGLYVSWGLQSVDGLLLDGVPASPDGLRESGPEELLREALAAIRAEAGLTETERKN